MFRDYGFTVETASEAELLRQLRAALGLMDSDTVFNKIFEVREELAENSFEPWPGG
jgi:hypothetical protein